MDWHIPPFIAFSTISNFIGFSFKAACHANPGAGKKNEWHQVDIF